MRTIIDGVVQDVEIGSLHDPFSKNRVEVIGAESLITSDEAKRRYGDYKKETRDLTVKRVWDTLPLHIPPDMTFKSRWRIEETYTGNDGTVLEPGQLRGWELSGRAWEWRIRVYMHVEFEKEIR